MTEVQPPTRAIRRASYDVLVIGAGVFGVWTACRLHEAGKRVAVIDAIGAAHARASSGGSSRVARCGYGDRELYTRWAWQSLSEWRALAARSSLSLFCATGVLWVHGRTDELAQATARVLAAQAVPFAQLTASELRRRYPVMRVGDNEAGLLEPAGGALMARNAVRFLAGELAAQGVRFLSGKIAPIRQAQADHGALRAVTTVAGERIEAGQFVCAAGPWLERLCPDVMAGRLSVTRQEVCFFSVGASATGDLPVWADLPFYGFPALDGHGFKVANHMHGPEFDPDTTERHASQTVEGAARTFLARRFPSLANAALAESRVCQYANSEDSGFVIDRHPGLDNVWLVGCGSGHGFKHGPAVGRHVAELVAGTTRPLEAFKVVR